MSRIAGPSRRSLLKIGLGGLGFWSLGGTASAADHRAARLGAHMARLRPEGAALRGREGLEVLELLSELDPAEQRSGAIQEVLREALAWVGESLMRLRHQLARVGDGEMLDTGLLNRLLHAKGRSGRHGPSAAAQLRAQLHPSRRPKTLQRIADRLDRAIAQAQHRADRLETAWRAGGELGADTWAIPTTSSGLKLLVEVILFALLAALILMGLLIIAGTTLVVVGALTGHSWIAVAGLVILGLVLVLLLSSNSSSSDDDPPSSTQAGQKKRKKRKKRRKRKKRQGGR